MSNSGIFRSARFLSGIEEFLYGSNLILIQPSIHSSAANLTRPSIMMDIGVFFRKLMPSKALSSFSFLFGSGSNGIHNIGSRILKLLLSSGPSTVFMAIVPIIVDSIQGFLSRSMPHIFKKVLESNASRVDGSPSFANTNAATAPIFIVFSVWVFAALDHIRPSIVHRLKFLISHGRGF